MSRSAVDVARELTATGNPSAALRVLRPAAERDTAPFNTRRALAELYRQMGYPDQAGRWGIVVEGWTTARERDRLARLIASSTYVRPARALLHLPDGMTYTPEMVEVIERDAPAHRKRMQERTGLPYDVEPETPAKRIRENGWLAIFIAVLVFFVGCIAAFLVELLQIADGNTWLLVVGGLSILCVGVGLLAVSLGHTLGRHYGRAFLALLGGVLLSVGGIAALSIAVGFL